MEVDPADCLAMFDDGIMERAFLFAAFGAFDYFRSSDGRLPAGNGKLGLVGLVGLERDVGHFISLVIGKT